ncbi:MAG: DNA-processing protein DprA, partial [Verrucomicrobiota bacterium]
RTIAVLGSGFTKLYPPENKNLAEKIAENGAVVSQFPFDITSDPRLFPIRNQTVSGMSYGVIVIEGNLRSGSMITAKAAVEQNRLVFGLPGPIDRQTSGGPNSLIQDGAKLITNAADVVQELPLVMPVAATEPEPTELNVENLAPEDLAVYSALSDRPTGIDEISAQANLPPHRVSTTLVRLEMQGLARQLPGMLFEKVGC